MKSLFENFLPDFISSDNFLFLPPSMKIHADHILSAFISSLEPVNTHPDPYSGIYNFYFKTSAHFHFDYAVKKNIPILLDSFFTYCTTSGNIPSASEWLEHHRHIQDEFHKRLRADGTIKGESFVKEYTPVGRNDLCPCGSGIKFKKCCMKFIS